MQRKEPRFAVGPVLLGFFLFVVVGSSTPRKSDAEDARRETTTVLTGSDDVWKRRKRIASQRRGPDHPKRICTWTVLLQGMSAAKIILL